MLQFIISLTFVAKAASRPITDRLYHFVELWNLWFWYCLSHCRSLQICVPVKSMLLTIILLTSYQVSPNRWAGTGVGIGMVLVVGIPWIENTIIRMFKFLQLRNSCLELNITFSSWTSQIITPSIMFKFLQLSISNFRFIFCRSRSRITKCPFHASW